MIYLLTITDWRNIWIAISIIIIVFLPLVSYILVKNINFSSREIIEDKKFKEENIKQWKRIEVLKDFKFYIICANMLAMPWIATGVFIYQSFIISSKNWGPYVIAQSFMSYSVLSVITLFISGFLIDKFTSRKLLVYMNIPLLLAVIVIFYFTHPITWAEIYGVKYIGSIKALTTALMVFSTAFGTALFGILIDLGFSIEEISVVAGIYIAISLFSLILIRKRLNPIII
jgi:hypothetical protein